MKRKPVRQKIHESEISQGDMLTATAGKGFNSGPHLYLVTEIKDRKIYATRYVSSGAFGSKGQLMPPDRILNVFTGMAVQV